MPRPRAVLQMTRASEKRRHPLLSLSCLPRPTRSAQATRQRFSAESSRPSSRPRRVRWSALLLGGALLASLSACTGTEERAPALRLALLLGGGSALATVDTAPPAEADLATFTPTLSTPVLVEGGRALHTVTNGQAFLLTRAGAVERRDVSGGVVNTFAAPPFDPCFRASALNPTRTRLLVLSQCENDAAQRLALYTTEGTLLWRAALGSAPVPLPGPDVPPILLAVVGDVGVVSRPALGGGSEIIRAAPRASGDAALDQVAVTSLPERTVAVRDLALLGTAVQAATDSGVYPLLDTGLPDLTRRVAALGEGRVDRLWGFSLGTRTVLFAWRDTSISGAGDPYLRVWDGNPATTTSQNVTYATDLRDLTVAPDGNLYVLSSTALNRYDLILGLQNGNWQPRSLLFGLNDARALTWLAP